MPRLAALAFLLLLVPALALAPKARAGDAAAGEQIFKRLCSTCHITTATGPSRQGPTLFGVVGRASGGVEGYRYSPANKKAGLVWTPDVLDKYLAAPREMVPGTTMIFGGLKRAEERANLIAYLEALR